MNRTLEALDEILWSDEQVPVRKTYTIRQLIDVYVMDGRLRHPLLCKTVEGYDDNSTAGVEIAREDMYWIYEVKRQNRLVLRCSDDWYLTVPADYPIPLDCYEYVNGSYHATHTMTVNDVMNEVDRGKESFIVKFCQKTMRRVSFEIAEEQGKLTAEFGLMPVVGVYQEEFIIALSVIQTESPYEQQEQGNVISIPTYVDVTFALAAGFRDGNGGREKDLAAGRRPDYADWFQRFSQLQRNKQVLDVKLFNGITKLRDDPTDDDYVNLKHRDVISVRPVVSSQRSQTTSPDSKSISTDDYDDDDCSPLYDNLETINSSFVTAIGPQQQSALLTTSSAAGGYVRPPPRQSATLPVRPSANFPQLSDKKSGTLPVPKPRIARPGQTTDVRNELMAKLDQRMRKLSIESSPYASQSTSSGFSDDNDCDEADYVLLDQRIHSEISRPRNDSQPSLSSKRPPADPSPLQSTTGSGYSRQVDGGNSTKPHPPVVAKHPVSKQTIPPPPPPRGVNSSSIRQPPKCAAPMFGPPSPSATTSDQQLRLRLLSADFAVESLTKRELSDIMLRVLRLPKDVVDRMYGQDVNGALLVGLTSEILVKEFQLSELQAVKVRQFALQHWLPDDWQK